MKTLNFYTHLISALEAEGYKEEDIVLVSNIFQDQTTTFDQLKPILNQDYHFEYPACDKHEPILVIEPTYFYLSDGTLVSFTGTHPVYDWDEYDDDFEFIYSVEKLRSKAIGDEFKIEIKPVRNCDEFNSYRSVLSLRGEDANTDTDVLNVERSTEADDQWVLLSSQKSVIVDFNPTLGLLIFDMKNCRLEEDAASITGFLKQLPIKWNEGLINQITAIVNEGTDREASTTNYTNTVNFFQGLNDEPKS